ncbi:peptidase C45 [Blastopirellula marina]|uniref:peptidase C45 n=1 Tax=Blastopirellula marina TaxID=124 RepID=UPI001E5F4C45|nr:peptidase C45 [Blastopirellula marina]
MNSRTVQNVIAIIGIGLLCSGLNTKAFACTTAVISGRATIDGRPILWKNRDTRDTNHNEVIQWNDGKYKAIAVVNAGGKSAVWMGVNEAGFCIENSVSRDLSAEGEKKGPGNGGFMKLALETCETVADFKRLLEETDKEGRKTIANFGVIDAKGGAALFETGPYKHLMFDANDPATAPDGVIVRSNFATSACELPAEPAPEQITEIASHDRYLRACSLLKKPDQPKISFDYVLRNCARDLCDAELAAIPGSVNSTEGSLPERISTANTISRSFTVSVAVFHGVRPGEDPRLTTMWTMLGEPTFTIAVPCWVSSSEVAVQLTGSRGSRLGELANSLRTWNYVNEEDTLRGAGMPELWSKLWQVEDKIVEETLRKREAWLKTEASTDELTKQHQAAVAEAYEALESAFTTAKQKALDQPSAPLPDFSLPLATTPVTK